MTDRSDANLPSTRLSPVRAWPRHRLRSATVLPVILIAAGCGGEADARAPATAVDSAGIEIVESERPAWAEGEEWRVSAQPALEIGMAEGPTEYLLSGVRLARRRSDGAIVVANSRSDEIRVFAANGRHLQTIGREGGGPGEFQALNWIHTLPGDSLLAYDYRRRLLSLFSPSGELVRSSALAGAGETTPAQIIGAFDDGTLAARVIDLRSFRPTEEAVNRMPEYILRFTASGELVDTLVVQPGADTYLESTTTSEGVRVVHMSTPMFGRTSVAGVVGDYLVLGTNDSYELELVGADGELERLVRRRTEPRPVTERMLSAARQERLAGAPNPEERRRQEESMRSVPHGVTVPFYERVLGDDAGYLWVQEFTVPGEDPPGWAVYDADGRLLGSVHLPPRFHPTHIGDDFVLGVMRDELDVERVQLYSLEKTGIE